MKLNALNNIQLHVAAPNPLIIFLRENEEPHYVKDLKINLSYLNPINRVNKLVFSTHSDR
jgi:hypothetical protein